MNPIKPLFEDKALMVFEKPAGVVVFPEGQTKENTFIEALITEYPHLKDVGEAPRYGIVHRLDKDTSGLLLVAKTQEGLIFLQKQFKNRGVEKKYLCLVEGSPKEEKGVIHTFIARSPKDPRKQKAYQLTEAHPESAREAITHYRALERYEGYTLLEADIKTGRRHQIRCHLASLHHPIAGDKLYGFKDSATPKGLSRQFLHASYLKIQLPDGSIKEFISELPEDLQHILTTLEKTYE